MPLEPINYMVNQQNQGNSLLEGLQLGQAMKQIGAQRVAEQQAADLKVQYASDLKSAFNNPTPESFAMLSTKYPTQREAFKQSFEMLEAPKKAAELQTTGQVYTALLNNKPEIANGIISEQITALENSGKDASKLKKIQETIAQDPHTATGIAGFMLSNMMGQKEFKDYQDALGTAGKETREKGLFPAKLEEAVGKGKEATSVAQTAAVKAKFAESDAVKDLEKKGWDIKKIQSDIQIAKINSQIAAMNAATNRETNSLKRQELGLKVQEMYQKRDDTVREKISTATTAFDATDAALNTIARIREVGRKKTATGKVYQAALGPLQGRSFIPTVSGDTANFEALVEDLKSKNFMTAYQALKGAGGIGEKEGASATKAIGNLDLLQTEDQFFKNLDVVEKNLMKGRKNIETKYGIRQTVPDTPDVQVSPKEANDILKKLGVL